MSNAAVATQAKFTRGARTKIVFLRNWRPSINPWMVLSLLLLVGFNAAAWTGIIRLIRAGN